jgi:hypothetical protein
MEKLVLGRLQVDLKSSGILQTVDFFHYRERWEQRLLIHAQDRNGGSHSEPLKVERVLLSGLRRSGEHVPNHERPELKAPCKTLVTTVEIPLPEPQPRSVQFS